MIAIFSQPVYLTLPERFPLECCYDSGARKTRMMSLTDRQVKFEDILNHYFRDSQPDGQTDGWTDLP